MTSSSYELIVVGEGAAGLTAARVAARLGMRTATFEAVLFGGLITNINHLDPAPSSEEPPVASGADLGADLYTASVEAGAESIGQNVTSLSRDADGFVVRTEESEYRAAQVVIASGARLRLLGVPGETEFVGRGVSQCADCDGPMFHGKEVVVVGGGDSALQEALALAEYCAQVHLVHRDDKFSGRDDLVARVSSHKKIRILWGRSVAAIEGEKTVERVRLVGSDGASSTMPIAGVFAYVGLEPNVAFLPKEVAVDPMGRVTVNEQLESTIPGLFAAGIVRAGCGGTVDDAIQDGRMAARSVVSHRR